MAKSVLVVGGTGPTGPHILEGLLQRGFDVTIFHRGTHEPSDLPEVRHIHGDPHFRETIAESLGDKTYDVVLAAYGRTKYLAEAFAGRTDHFLAIGGSPRYAGFNEPQLLRPQGPAMPLREDAPSALMLDAAVSPAIKFAHMIVRTEEAVFESHPDATFFIYPIVYGPRTVWPWEWSVIRRVRDGREHLFIPDEGLALQGRVAARNAAELLLRAIDQPERAKGQRYNAGDERQYSVRQWVELLLEALGASPELVSVPSSVVPWVRAMYLPTAGSVANHTMLDTSKARYELGLRDVIGIREAVAEIVEWYERHPVDEANAPAFVDKFDYALEDRLLAIWHDRSADVYTQARQELPEDEHPMAHPKSVGVLNDQKGR
ncbi:NAD-dependent epimerase/dehydratase [Mycolicibacterium rhodesiae JS60]|nr:NAD-dependent epimerase/dehydratase [Mycolicibacterium rhodesiae JS60]